MGGDMVDKIQQSLLLCAEIDVLMGRMKARTDKGKENYTFQDSIEAYEDDLKTKALLEKIKRLNEK